MAKAASAGPTIAPVHRGVRVKVPQSAHHSQPEGYGVVTGDPDKQGRVPVRCYPDQLLPDTTVVVPHKGDAARPADGWWEWSPDPWEEGP